MKEYDVPGDVSGLSQRLDALNGILGGIRKMLMENEQQVDQLRQRGELFHRDLEGLRYYIQTGKAPGEPIEDFSSRIKEMNSLLGQLKEELTHQADEESCRYREALEKIEGVEKTQGAIKDRCSALEGAEAPRLEIPTEIWARLGATEATLGSMGSLGESVQELRGRLVQIEEERDALRNELSQTKSEVSSFRMEGQGSKDNLHAAMGRLEGEVQRLQSSLEGGAQSLGARIDQSCGRLSGVEEMLHSACERLEVNRQDIEKLYQSRNESKAVLDGLDRSISLLRADQESTSQSLESLGMKGGHHEEQTRQLQAEVGALKHQAESLMASLEGAIENLRAHSQRVSTIQGEMGERVSAIQGELGEAREVRGELQLQVSTNRDEFSAALKEVRFDISGVREDLEKILRRQGELESSFQTTTDLKVEGVSKALTLNLEGERRKMNEDFESIKKGQRELGDLKGAVEERERESKEARQEIHRIKEHLEGLRGDLHRQRTFGVGALAACAVLGFAFLMTIGTHQDGVEQLVGPALSEAPAVQSASIPLDDISMVADNDILASVGQGLEEELSFPDEEPTKEVQPISSFVSPAFEPAPAEQSTQPEKSSKKEVKYVVKDGDSFWSIAQKHKTSEPINERVEKIKKDNALKSASLRPGQVLKIFM